MKSAPPSDAGCAPQSSRRGGGPRSPKGKSRSSANATKHGVTGLKPVLLHAERLSEYRLGLERWLFSLCPISPAEVAVVSRLHDLEWRLGRLERIEQKLLTAKVEEGMKVKPEYGAVSASIGALKVSNELVEVIETTPGDETTVLPQPAFSSFLAGCRQLVPVVELAVGQAQVARLKRAIDGFEATRGGPGSIPAMRGIGKAATELVAVLTSSLKQKEKALAKLRNETAAGTLLDERDQKLLGRYRSAIEKSMQAQLQILSDLRAQVDRAERRRKSRQHPEDQAQVTLRVVR